MILRHSIAVFKVLKQGRTKGRVKIVLHAVEAGNNAFLLVVKIPATAEAQGKIPALLSGG